MPGHLHAGPQCTELTGRPCNAGGARCSHRECLNGGPLLGCQKTRNGDYFCFHREYYLGSDVVNDAEAARLQRELNGGAAQNGPVRGTLVVEIDPIGDLIRDFSRRPGNGAFPNVPREKVAQELLVRARNAASINQGRTWMCGPAAFMYSVVKDRPLDYVRFVIDLYETGRGRLGSLRVTPSVAFRNDRVAPGSLAVDWVALGSLRDSDNVMFEYHYSGSIVEHIRGGTRAGEIISWFERAGYRDVRDWTMGHGQSMNALLANEYLAKGYKVCLRIDADLLGDEKDVNSFSIFPNHYVILTSPIQMNDDGVEFTVYTWRTERWRVPQGTCGRIPLATFLSKYYGFIAAKP